jgi:hypothetical protein
MGEFGRNSVAEGSTVVLGIPVPSTDSGFLGLVGIHVAFGLCAVATGLIAMLSPKGRGRHARFATIYFWSLFGVFVTMSLLSLVRWAEDYPLFILGALAFGCAYLGRMAIRHRQPRWHLIGMAASYTLMLTAFYVDNGKNLPLWRDLPQIAFWFIPGMVGIPVTVYFLIRLPKFKL